jgi:hypothetical protein
MAFGGRFYKRNGRKLPSVTTICGILDKPALVYWAANCAVDYIFDEIQPFETNDEMVPTKELWPIIEAARKNWRKVSAKALDIGSAVHAAIERYLKTKQEPEAPSNEVLSAFLAFLEWKDQHKLEVIQTEHTVYAELYAGTTDLIAMLDGKKYIIDFKTFTETSTTQPPYPEAKYQIAAYRSCVPDAEGSGILYLGKGMGIMKWVDVSESYQTDLEIFNHLVQVYYLTHPELGR